MKDYVQQTIALRPVGCGDCFWKIKAALEKLDGFLEMANDVARITITIKVRGDLSSAGTAVKLSRATFRKIRQNYFWAWFDNGPAIPLASIGLLHAMIGMAAMAMSSVNVITNSLRLRKAKAFSNNKLSKMVDMPL